MAKNVSKTGKIISSLAKFQKECREANLREKEEFENKWHKKFCFLPTRTSPGKWVWLVNVYVRYRAGNKVSNYPGPEHYLRLEYQKNGRLEVLTKKQCFVKKLKE